MLGHYSTWVRRLAPQKPQLATRQPVGGNPFNPGPVVASSSMETPKMDLITSLKAFGLDVVTFDETGFHPTADVAGPQPDKVTGGWEGRSDASMFKRFVLFEVGGIVEAAAFKAWALDTGKQFKSLMGSWRGKHNPSFIMEDTGANRLAIAYWLQKQEAILCIGPAYRKREDGQYQLFGNRAAILDWLEPDGYTVLKREAVDGLWQAVSKATALRQESWTFDPTDQQYYAVV